MCHGISNISFHLITAPLYHNNITHIGVAFVAVYFYKDDMSTYYEILGVAVTSSTDDVKKAYKKLAIRWHPG